MYKQVLDNYYTIIDLATGRKESSKEAKNSKQGIKNPTKNEIKFTGKGGVTTTLHITNSGSTATCPDSGETLYDVLVTKILNLLRKACTCHRITIMNNLAVSKKAFPDTFGKGKKNSKRNKPDL